MHLRLAISVYFLYRFTLNLRYIFLTTTYFVPRPYGRVGTWGRLFFVEPEPRQGMEPVLNLPFFFLKSFRLLSFYFLRNLPSVIAAQHTVLLQAPFCSLSIFLKRKFWNAVLYWRGSEHWMVFLWWYKSFICFGMFAVLLVQAGWPLMVPFYLRFTTHFEYTPSSRSTFTFRTEKNLKSL